MKLRDLCLSYLSVLAPDLPAVPAADSKQCTASPGATDDCRRGGQGHQERGNGKTGLTGTWYLGWEA